jgi:hypothetical protein
MLASAACMGVLIFLAFFGAYAGQTVSQPPIPRPVEQSANIRDLIGLFTLIAIAVQAYFLWRAVRSADASASVSKQALVDVQRAFVFLRTFEFHFINRNVHIMPLWENSGSTPANDRTNWVNWKSFVGEPPTEFYLADLDANGKKLDKSRTFTITFIGPHATQYGEILTIPLDTIKAVNDLADRLFIWGWTEYRDVFDDTPIHRTEFCNEVRVTDFVRDDAANTTKAYLHIPIHGPYNTAK